MLIIVYIAKTVRTEPSRQLKPLRERRDSVIAAELCADRARSQKPEIALSIRGEGGGENRGATSVKPKYSISVGGKVGLEGRHCAGRADPANTRFRLGDDEV